MAECSFPKSSRLLKAASFKAVFDNPRYKVSCRHLLILASPNSVAQARLGIVVARKHVARAYQRNRIKRVIREAFRQRRGQLGELDLIVLVRGDADRLNNPSLFARLDGLWNDLNAKCQQRPARSNREGATAHNNTT